MFNLEKRSKNDVLGTVAPRNDLSLLLLSLQLSTLLGRSFRLISCRNKKTGVKEKNILWKQTSRMWRIWGRTYEGAGQDWLNFEEFDLKLLSMQQIWNQLHINAANWCVIASASAAGWRGCLLAEKTADWRRASNAADLGGTRRLCLGMQFSERDPHQERSKRIIFFSQP